MGVIEAMQRKKKMRLGVLTAAVVAGCATVPLTLGTAEARPELNCNVKDGHTVRILDRNLQPTDHVLKSNEAVLCGEPHEHHDWIVGNQDGKNLGYEGYIPLGELDPS